MRRYIIFMISGMLLIATTSFAQLSTKSSWKSLDEGVRSSALGFADDYVSFLARARTELTTVQETRKLVETEGFQVLTESLSWRAGAKLYDVNRDRTVCVIVAGRRPISEGVRVIASHIDSPRLELKARPLYEKQGFAMFQTVYHGGIKKYQWVNVPLALTGRIDKTDGSTIWVDIGRHPDDPVFIIPDLAPHVDRDYRKRTASDVIKGEELDPLAGSMATDSVSVEKQVLEYLSQTYDMSEADFISSEFALVPAMDPRDVGFDRGLMVGYGHDDRLCAYASLRASVAVSQPEYTTISFLADNEESGSNNNTGARSDYLRGLIQRLMSLERGGDVSELDLRKALPNVHVLSADVTTGINPQYAGVQEHGNAAQLSYGVVIKRYGRGNDPNSEFTAHFRSILERDSIPYQTHTYKVDVGGGGTLGGFLSTENMEVLDCGVPLLSMHSTYSVASKIDLWWLYQAFTAFYRQ